ncbi:MAG: hypothetical protein JNK82_35010, partial [Myxococcaceae bacterium]|nr:hypothetical protein [Myxococcaceae bacterium]
LTYRRKLTLDALTPRAALGMLTMAGLSMLSSLNNSVTTPQQYRPPEAQGSPAEGRPLGPRMPGFTGRFDELSGEVDMVDLTNPQYECRVRLLEAD